MAVLILLGTIVFYALALIAMCIPVVIAWDGSLNSGIPEMVLLSIATVLWLLGWALSLFGIPIGIGCIIFSGLFAVFALEGDTPL